MIRIFFSLIVVAIFFSCKQKSEEEYVAESKSLLQNEDFQGAIGILNQAIQEYESSTLYNLRGVAAFESGDINRSIEDFNVAIKLDTTDYRPFYNRGKAYFEIGEFSNARIDFSIAMDLNPSIADIYINQGNTLFELNEYEQALENFDFAIKLDDKSYLAHLNKGRALIALRYPGDAITHIERSIAIDSKRGDAFYYLAYAKFLTGADDYCLLYEKSQALGFVAEDDVLAKKCVN